MESRESVKNALEALALGRLTSPQLAFGSQGLAAFHRFTQPSALMDSHLPQPDHQPGALPRAEVRSAWQAGGWQTVVLAFVVPMVLAGCTRPYGPAYPPAGQYPQAAAVPQIGANTGPASVFAQQQTHPQLLDLQRRVRELDENNRLLTTQIAQLQQQTQAYRERAELLAKQLQDANEQNKQLLATTQQYASRAQQLQQSMTARGGAKLTANNSLAAGASALRIQGATVVPDGDLIRIRIPADQLFVPGTQQISPSGAMVLDQVATVLLRQYPRQRVAVEGHTDTGTGGFTTAYQLATAQAQAVLDQLVRRNGVPAQQLFIVSHGPNYPLADNSTPAGRAENRRIEIVIYPETF
ncbi:MAG: OmpA family protein [Planctomycetota bacterium]|nr:MAG: OmpA family protein [Planctomycetota bacterium]